MHNLVILDPQMIFEDIWGKTIFWSFFYGRVVFHFLGYFLPTKNANVCHWTPSNDFWGELRQKQVLESFSGSYGSHIKQMFVIGHPQMTFGDIWDKKRNFDFV